MKIKNIYKTAFFVGIALVLLGSSQGPGSAGFQVTGAPGSLGQNFGQPGTCANSGCHSGGTFAPTLTITLLDGANPVTAYEPGKTYNLKLTITPSSGTPLRYGFQAVSLNSSNNQAGDWGNLGTGKKKTPIANRFYAEHSAPSTSGTFEMEWIAPNIGTGPVTIYAAGNAADGTGGTANDAIDSDNLVLQEMPANSVFNADREAASLLVMPNPVGETLHLAINSRISGDHHIRVMDVAGNMVATAPILLQHGDQTTSIPVPHLPPGLYIVQLCGDGHLAAVQMLKR